MPLDGPARADASIRPRRLQRTYPALRRAVIRRYADSAYHKSAETRVGDNLRDINKLARSVRCSRPRYAAGFAGFFGRCWSAYYWLAGRGMAARMNHRKAHQMNLSMRFVLLVLTAIVLAGGPGLATLPDPVRIDAGLVSGVAGGTANMRVFKGIPFAAPPVGPLRWRPPQPVGGWAGVRPPVRPRPVGSARRSATRRCVLAGDGHEGPEDDRRRLRPRGDARAASQ